MKKFALLQLAFFAILFTAQIADSEEVNTPPAPPQPKEIAVPQDPNYVVMTLDGNELTIGKMKYFTPDLNYETIKEIADFWLNTQLLYEEAVKKGIEKDPKTKFLADISYKKAIVGDLIKKVQDEANVSNEQVKKYYEDNKETDPSMKDPNYLSFSHITVDTLEKAQDVLKRINSGEEINALAKELSVAADAKKGGQVVKYVQRNVSRQFGQEFEDALIKASEGDIIGPIKNKDGKYEIARHEGLRLGHIIEFDKVKGRIKGELERKAKGKAVDDLIKSLKENAAQRYKKMGIFSEKNNAAEANKKSEKK